MASAFQKFIIPHKSRLDEKRLQSEAATSWYLIPGPALYTCQDKPIQTLPGVLLCKYNWRKEIVLHQQIATD